MPTLHVHVDESGSFNFSPHGSDYFVFAATWTYNPYSLAKDLQELRYSLLREGEDIDHFHAADDKTWQRDHVIDVLLDDEDWQFAATVIPKQRVYKQFHDRVRFYPKFLPHVLKFVFRGRMKPGTDRVLIYTDRLPINKEKKAAKKAIKQFCASELPEAVTWYVYHHDTASNAWLQVADYCAWSVNRKHEHGDDSYYERLRPRLAARELVLWED